jgi:hypothetical protein
MTIEGVKDYELVRDFLYLRMRGARGQHEKERTAEADLASALREAAEAMRSVREALEKAVRERR